MTEKRRTENIVQLTDTIWEVNKYKILKKIEKDSGAPVPKDCHYLIEYCIRYGAVLMEQTVGKDWRTQA